MEPPSTPTQTPNPIPTVLLCALCDKPFTRELQYKRHIAYCRKSQGRKRLRSCRACNQSKIKCNAGAPCHQCVRKGVECVFDQQRRDGVARKNGEIMTTTVVTVASSDAALIQPDMGVELDYGLANDDSLGHVEEIERVEFCALPQLQLPNSPDKDGAESTKSTMMDELSERASSSTTTTTLTRTTPEENNFLSLLNDTFTSDIITDINFQLEDYNYFTNGKELQLPTFSPILLPTSTTTTTTRETSLSPISETAPSRHFTQKTLKTAIQKIHATMITDMIRAYPLMMTRRETLPPFIHAFSPAPSTSQNQDLLPTHLTNCMAIAQLHSIRTADTSPFIWASIRSEIRGFRERLDTFDGYDALSALQASLLYFIIRAVDEEPRLEAGDDLEMLVIYQEVCKRAVELASGSVHFVDRNGTWNESNMSWKEWIFMESIRRVAIVWYILGLIYHMRTGRFCFVSDHFREILLPCTRTEWEAKSESEWKKEHVVARNLNYASMTGQSSLVTFGDLIEAHKHRRVGQLARWNAGVDQLGMVLNLAVGMIA